MNLHPGRGMLDLLLQKRILPKIRYEKQAWPMKQTFDEACAFYLGRFEMGGGLSEEQRERKLKSIFTAR